MPLETALAGMPGLEHVRSQSLFGLSDIKCYFSWGTAYKDARQETLNRIQMANLPAGLQPALSPWSPIGEIYRYVLRGEGYSLTDLKTAQDWILEKQFRQVPGVVDVVGFGGKTKQFHVEIDPVHQYAIPAVDEAGRVLAGLQSIERREGDQWEVDILARLVQDTPLALFTHRSRLEEGKRGSAEFGDPAGVVRVHSRIVHDEDQIEIGPPVGGSLRPRLRANDNDRTDVLPRGCPVRDGRRDQVHACVHV